MFSHCSRMSAGREFHVAGAATEKARRASSVCTRGTTSIRASEERRARGGARSVPARWDTLEWLWSAPCESVQPVYRWPAASPEASVASEAAAWRRCDPGSGRRLWPGCSGRAVAYRKSPPVRHSTVHCSSPSHLGPPRCIKCNSPSINGQCTNHRIAVRCSEILMCPLKG